MSVTPKVDPKIARDALWRRGHLSWLLDANQKQLYDLYYNTDHRVQTWLLARRCLAEGTLIKTPKGLVKIEDLKIGDEVFGYNEDGSVSISKILQTFENGEKEVWDLCNNGRVLETCTKDHVWLTLNEYDAKYVERPTHDIKKYNKIVREWVSFDELTGIHEPHAYAIGALLGDGCSRQGVNKIYISSENDIIPKKVAEVLGVKYVYNNSEVNYTWCISNEEWKPVGAASHNTTKVNCNYYEEWCKDRYAHEKIADLNVIKTWSPESQLAFLAGVIDTDGSLCITKDNCLMYSIEMQSLSVIQACQYIIHNLFQHKCTIHINDRDKFVNGPTYSIKVKNNFICKKMLRKLNKHQVVERKKWKNEYQFFKENNTNPAHVGVKVKNPRIMKTYDIAIDNKTNLYLTANGLVTHNSGKSYCLCVLAIETCLKKPGAIIKFLAPTRVQVNLIIRPLMRKLLETCPDDIKPEYKAKDNIFYFPNGSELQLSGTDGGAAERLRGGDSDLAIVDEAGSCTDLRYCVRDILLPTTLITKGKILLASTPPEDAEHDFVDFIEEAEARGSIVIKTIDDNPRIDKSEKLKLIEELGGLSSESTLRELYCKMIKSKTNSVVPEFTEEKLPEIVTDQFVLPPFYDAYVSMDLGYKDWTVILFAYYDFRNDKVIIQDEIITYGNEMYLDKLGAQILQKEKQLWTHPISGELIKPKKRVSDHNLIAINEIKRATNYQIHFELALKETKHASINNLRMMINANKILIHPKCVTLIRHLKNAKWASTTTKDTFARCPQGSHYDAVDACAYLLKAIDFKRNPYPKNFGFNYKSEDTYSYNNIPKVENENVYRKILNLKKRY
jgi:hypothetical protein